MFYTQRQDRRQRWRVCTGADSEELKNGPSPCLNQDHWTVAPVSVIQTMLFYFSSFRPCGALVSNVCISWITWQGHSHASPNGYHGPFLVALRLISVKVQIEITQQSSTQKRRERKKGVGAAGRQVIWHNILQYANVIISSLVLLMGDLFNQKKKKKSLC